MKKCPKCESQLSDDAKVCGNCGETLSSSADNYTFDYNSLYSTNNEPIQEEPATIEQPTPQETVVESVSIPEVSLTEQPAETTLENEAIQNTIDVPVPEVIPDIIPEVEPAEIIPEIGMPEPIDIPVASETLTIQEIPMGVPEVPIMVSENIPVENPAIVAEIPQVGNIPVSIPEMPMMTPQIENMGMPVMEPVQLTPVAEAPGMSTLEPIAPVAMPTAMPALETQQTLPYNAPLTPSDNNQKENKNNKIVFIVVMTVALIAVIVMAFFMIKMFSNNNNSTKNSEIGKATQYNYEGFEFFLPDNIIADVSNGEFILHATDKSWSAVITLQDGSYNTLVSNKSQLKHYYEQLGYVVEKAEEEKEISGTAFVTLEVNMASKKVLIAYSKANGTKLFGIILTTETNEYTNDSLKDIGKVLATMKYVGTNNDLPEGFTIDMFKETFRVAE